MSMMHGMIGAIASSGGGGGLVLKSEIWVPNAVVANTGYNTTDWANVNEDRATPDALYHLGNNWDDRVRYSMAPISGSPTTITDLDVVTSMVWKFRLYHGDSSDRFDIDCYMDSGGGYTTYNIVNGLIVSPVSTEVNFDYTPAALQGVDRSLSELNSLEINFYNDDTGSSSDWRIHTVNCLIKANE